MRSAVRRNMALIARQYDEMEALTSLAGERVERISGWSVGEHLEHLLKADSTILRYFPAPAEAPLPAVTLLGRFILATGWIPRGKGQAPAATRPDAPSPERLLGGLAEIRSLFATVVTPEDRLLDPTAIAKHPYFGGFNRAQWLRWVVVHHRHHAKIVRDILRADPD